MKPVFEKIKALLSGQWTGNGTAQFPTITGTGYREQTAFVPDEYKDILFYQQKAWYQNDTANNGQTVFWDAGFIRLHERHIILNSVQSGGRMEILELAAYTDDRFVFNSRSILEDEKTIRSQRIFERMGPGIRYQLYMATRQAPDFQLHLQAVLNRENKQL